MGILSADVSLALLVRNSSFLWIAVVKCKTALVDIPLICIHLSLWITTSSDPKIIPISNTFSARSKQSFLDDTSPETI